VNAWKMLNKKIGLNPNYGELYAGTENYRIAGKQES
jgi:hypothetical protein